MMNNNVNKQNKIIIPKEKNPKIINEPEQTFILNKDKEELRIELGIEDIIKITVCNIFFNCFLLPISYFLEP